MPTYTAPVEDMMFLFEKLRNNKEYNELEKYKEVTPDLVKDILQEAAKINQNLILPLAKVGDENPAILENGVVRELTDEEQAIKEKEITDYSSKALDRALNMLRMKRNNLLAETDWWGASDNTMTSEQTQYRKDLRDITNGLITVEQVENVEFPTKP